uniref:Ovule protein n=1 Tax=Hymenolepis diminuta TaxID=6216 RepID=A0A0R3SY43_HYMDI
LLPSLKCKRATQSGAHKLAVTLLLSLFFLMLSGIEKEEGERVGVHGRTRPNTPSK